MDSALFSEVRAVVQRARAAGVQTIVAIATAPEELAQGLTLCEEGVYLAAATPPHDVVEEDPLLVPIEEAIAQGRLVAIGETGLDYHYYSATRELQKRSLARYLSLARESQLPVVIHCREAFQDLFKALDDFPEVRGVCHCFTGTRAEAEELLARGWLLSLSGIVTFKKSLALRECVAALPLESLLLETDAPFLAPQSRRGSRNEPAYLTETAQAVAELLQQPLARVVEQTARNAQQFFALPLPVE